MGDTFVMSIIQFSHTLFTKYAWKRGSEDYGEENDSTNHNSLSKSEDKETKEEVPPGKGEAGHTL